MGSGIAQICLERGFSVDLYDSDSGSIDRAKTSIRRGLEIHRSKGQLSAGAFEEAWSSLKPVDTLVSFSSAQVIIEAIPERRDLKAAFFRRIDPIASDAKILASNTSSISITELAAETGRPERVIGLHFMNPVSVMKLIEVIRGDKTSEACFQSAKAFASALGKTVVVSADRPGFIVNRILIPMINEAAYALMEGVANPKDIDQAMKLGANHPMGPLALADLIGLDVCLDIAEVLHAKLGDERYRPCPLLREMVEAGRLGRKSGKGFHQY